MTRRVVRSVAWVTFRTWVNPLLKGRLTGQLPSTPHRFCPTSLSVHTFTQRLLRGSVQLEYSVRPLLGSAGTLSQDEHEDIPPPWTLFHRCRYWPSRQTCGFQDVLSRRFIRRHTTPLRSLFCRTNFVSTLKASGNLSHAQEQATL
jgi:hypothetical protein